MSFSSSSPPAAKKAKHGGPHHPLRLERKPEQNGGTLDDDGDDSKVATLVDPKILAALDKHNDDRYVKYFDDRYVSKGEFQEFKDRLDLMVDTFRPATEFALFETAIYECVAEEQYMPEEWKSSAARIKHAIAALCAGIMDVLLLSKEEDETPTKLSWQGPSSTTRGKEGKQFPKEMKGPLVLRGLAGLVIYIEMVEKAVLEQWDRSQRNQFSHNGSLLDSLYSSPEGKKSKTLYDRTKSKIKEMRKTLKEKAAETSGDQYGNVEDGITAVVDALEEKVGPIEQERIESAIQQLKEIVGNETPK